ncbi:MAG: hypothetical protein ACREXS_18505 [Gammaproteobacteria bacterium]
MMAAPALLLDEDVRVVLADIYGLVRYASADEPTLRGVEWIAQQWEAARLAATDAGKVLTDATV